MPVCCQHTGCSISALPECISLPGRSSEEFEALTPDERHPGHRLGQLKADLPDICGPFASPDAKELCYIALED